MAIDSPDRIDIRTLVIEEPRVEIVSSSPLTLITDNDWLAIEQILTENQEEWTPDFLYRLYELNVMFPERFAKYKSSKTFEHVKDEVKSFKESGSDNTNIVHTMELVKQLWPERLDRLAKQVKLQSFKNVIEDRLSWPQLLTTTLQHSASYRGIYPNENFQFNVDEMIQKLKDSDNVTFEADVKLDLNAARAYGSLRILAGDLPKGAVDKRRIDNSIAFLQERKQSESFYWFGSIEHTFYLSVLAAKEIKFTDRGLELVMPEPESPLATDKPPIPEVKKYGS